MALKLSNRDVSGVTVVSCSGRIVFGEEAADLREVVKSLLQRTKEIVINLGEVSYIDSGGLGTLVGLYTSARNVGGEIKLANVTQRVRDQLQITKLITVFDCYPSEQAAVNAFPRRATA
jgi:anti-sigma B factor antagonist